MAGRSANREVNELWQRLQAIRRRLDKEIFSDSDESAFSSTLVAHAEVVLRLKSIMQRRSRSGEKLLVELRGRTDIEDAA